MKEFLSALIAMVWLVGLVNGCGTDQDMSRSSASVSGRDAHSPEQPAESASGCDVLQGGAINTGTLPAGCAKIEGDQIGQKDIQVSLNGIEVTFNAWKSKDDEVGDFIGFSYLSSAAVCVSVKASTLRFVAEKAGEWSYPEDAGKPHGISNVVICQPTETESESTPDSSGLDNPADNDSAPANNDSGNIVPPSGDSTGSGSTGADEASSASGSTDSGSTSSDPIHVPVD